MTEKTQTTPNGFLQGFMVCLSIMTERGSEVQSVAREAWGAIGKPTNKALRKAGVEDFDIKTANAMRTRMK